MTRARTAGFGMLGLGSGCFLGYTPYSGPAKTMSSGLLSTANGSNGRVSPPFPGREKAMAALWLSSTIATTTLYFTFPGVSILLALVLTRIGTLLVPSSLDLLRHRRIRWYPAIATGHRRYPVDRLRQPRVLPRQWIGEIGPQRGPAVASGG